MIKKNPQGISLKYYLHQNIELETVLSQAYWWDENNLKKFVGNIAN